MSHSGIILHNCCQVSIWISQFNLTEGWGFKCFNTRSKIRDLSFSTDSWISKHITHPFIVLQWSAKMTFHAATIKFSRKWCWCFVLKQNWKHLGKFSRSTWFQYFPAKVKSKTVECSWLNFFDFLYKGQRRSSRIFLGRKSKVISTMGTGKGIPVMYLSPSEA